MKKFVVIRNANPNGSSGTGRVVDGVQFGDGKVVVQWTGINNGKRSVSVWDSLDDFVAVHVIPHPENDTQIIWEDGPNFPQD